MALDSGMHVLNMEGLELVFSETYNLMTTILFIPFILHHLN